MLERHRRAVMAVLFLVSLGYVLWLWSQLPDNGYPDSWYYRGVAERLAAGKGLTIPYLWNLLEVGAVIPPAGTLPIPAGAHWVPLASFVQVPGILLLGPSSLASALPFMLMAAALAPFSVLVARRMGLSAGMAAAAGLIAALPGPYAWFHTLPDNYPLFALLVGGSLWFLADAAEGRRPRRSMLLAGLLAGLASLSRLDGILLVAIIGLVALPGLLRRRAAPDRAGAALAAGGFLAVMLPWWARQMAVFGMPVPSTASGRITWIRTYSEMFVAGGGPFGPDHLLSWGPGPIIASRLGALGRVVELNLQFLFAFMLLLPALAGIVSLVRRSPLARLFLGWWMLHLAWSVVVAAPHVGSGNYIHGLGSVLPFAAAAIVAGTAAVTAFLARLLRLSGRSTAVCGASLLLIFLGWHLALTQASTGSLLRRSRTDVASDRAVIAGLREARLGPGTRVMSRDPGALWTLGGLPGLATITDPWDAARALVEAYGIEVIVFEPSVQDAMGAWVRAQPDLVPIDLGPDAGDRAAYRVVRRGGTDDAATIRGSPGTPIVEER